MYSSPKHRIKIDLHGMRFAEGKACAVKAIEQAIARKIPCVEVVTGRGIHARKENAPRGLFFKKIPVWINAMELRKHIYCIIKRVGSYTIILNKYKYNSYLGGNQDLIIDIEKKRFMENLYLNQSQLMNIINSPESTEKHLEIINFIRRNRMLLEKISCDGTTVLMVAAALNQVETMKCLLEYDNSISIQPRLLKKSREDGVNALMVAVMFENIDSINFLLNKAPSLLKMKQKNDVSVIQMAANTSNPRAMLEVLYQHLKSHYRQKGYTNFFREYKNFTATMPIIESNSFKKYNSEHAWFFYDRMSRFLRKNYKCIPKVNKGIRYYDIENDYKLKEKIIFLLKNNNIFKKLFLRFNHSQKIRYPKRFKHAKNIDFYFSNQNFINKNTRKYNKSLLSKSYNSFKNSKLVIPDLVHQLRVIPTIIVNKGLKVQNKLFIRSSSLAPSSELKAKVSIKQEKSQAQLKLSVPNAISVNLEQETLFLMRTQKMFSSIDNSCSLERFKKVVSQASTVNCPNVGKIGDTPLMAILRQSKILKEKEIEKIKILNEHSADWTVPNNKGETAKDLAMKHKQAAVISKLIMKPRM